MRDMQGFQTVRHQIMRCTVPVFAMIAFAATASAAQPEKYSAPDDPPLTIEQLIHVPSLQLKPSSVVGADIGWGRVNGTTLGHWRYSVSYRYTKQGWKVIAYSVGKSPAGESGQNPGRSQLSVKGGSDGGFHPNLMPLEDLPPGPGVIPKPDIPENPDQPAHENSAKCPVSPGFDAKYQWVWVPGHYQVDEYGVEIFVPGHWKLQQYSMAYSPTDYCGGH